jgi:predicted acyltransferase
MNEKKSARLYSLDVFRGMTIALMITVNIPGSWEFIYAPFKHAEWHGCTPTDLVFPFFLFIVGASSAFSFSVFNYSLNFHSFYKVIQRTIMIFLVGFMLNNFPFFSHSLTSDSISTNILIVLFRIIIALTIFIAILWGEKSVFSQIDEYGNGTKNDWRKWIFTAVSYFIPILILILFLQALYNFDFFNRDFSKIRIMGVLQRIALAYGFGSIIILGFKHKMIPYIAAGILLIYWGIMWYFGGADPYGIETNVGRQIDIFILGSSHLWMGKGIPFDPEGVMSTLPSISTVLIGFLCGKYILDNLKSKSQWIIRFLLSGAILVITGLIWSKLFPINKPLWTSSYVVFTAGLAILLWTVLYFLIDKLKLHGFFSFFKVFGVNPLFAFALHVIWVKIISGIIKWTNPDDTTTNAYGWIYHNIFQNIGGNYLGSLLFAISHIIFFYFILLILYKRKIYIKL